MFCQSCGFKNDTNALFCWKCGQELQKEVAVAGKALEKKQPEQKANKNKKNQQAVEVYFTEKEQWIFLGAMTVMLIGMTIFGFVGAK